MGLQKFGSREPQHRPPNTISLMIGTTKKRAPNFCEFRTPYARMMPGKRAPNFRKAVSLRSPLSNPSFEIVPFDSPLFASKLVIPLAATVLKGVLVRHLLYLPVPFLAPVTVFP